MNIIECKRIYKYNIIVVNAACFSLYIELSISSN